MRRSGPAFGGRNAPGRSSRQRTIASGYSTIDGEQLRRHERGEDAADHAADREQEIELGQPLGRRPLGGEAAVDEQRDEEEIGAVDADEQSRSAARTVGSSAVIKSAAATASDEATAARLTTATDSGPPREGRHEAEQVEGQRDHPEQRHRGDVGGRNVVAPIIRLEGSAAMPIQRMRTGQRIAGVVSFGRGWSRRRGSRGQHASRAQAGHEDEAARSRASTGAPAGGESASAR